MTTFEKAYPRNVVTDKFCMYIKRKWCEPEWLSLGEVMPESMSSDFSENITNGNKNDIYEYFDASKVTITLKAEWIDPKLQEIMYQGLYNINVYDEGWSVSWQQIIQPECYSTDPECIDNCILLCEHFCDIPTITVTQTLGKLSAPLTPWSNGDYIIQRDECNTYRYIKFINPDLQTKSKITIMYDGEVSAGWRKKRTECDSPKPFVMKLEARNGACGNWQTYTILLKDVIAKPQTMTPWTDNGTKTQYTIDLVWYICDESTQTI